MADHPTLADGTPFRPVPWASGELVEEAGEMCMDVTCPRCGKVIRCRERKDFESFSKAEYAAHFHARHSTQPAQ